MIYGTLAALERSNAGEAGLVCKELGVFHTRFLPYLFATSSSRPVSNKIVLKRRFLVSLLNMVEHVRRIVTYTGPQSVLLLSTTVYCTRTDNILDSRTSIEGANIMTLPFFS